MFDTLVFREAQWAHLFKLIDMASHDQEKSLTDTGGHYLHSSSPDEDWNGSSFVVPGHVDCDGDPSPNVLYPRRKEWPRLLADIEGIPADELTVIEHWLKECQDSPRQDNYLALSQSWPERQPMQTRDIHCGAFYGPHLFVCGEDEEGEPLTRARLLQHLKAVKVRSHPGFWDPVTLWKGYAKGYPTWETAIRCHTDMGPRWWEVRKALESELPSGYSWDSYQPHCGNLYVEGESK